MPSKEFWEGFWDLMKSPTFVETGKPKRKGRQYIRLIRNNKEIIIDVDDYEILEDEEIDNITSKDDLMMLDNRIKGERVVFERN